MAIVSDVGAFHLARLAEESANRRGDYPSLLFDGRWYGSLELFERAQRLAAGLTKLGVTPGERVVVNMANCPEVSMAYNAIWRAGAVVTPASFLLSPQELRHVIEDSEAAAVLTTPEFVEKVKEAGDGVESLRNVISTDGAADGAVSLASLESEEPGPIVERDDDDLAALLYTGGTTGQSKGVMLSHASLHFTGRSIHEASHVPGVNRALVTLPLSHSYGLLLTLGGMNNPEQGVAVLLRWFDPKQFLELIQEHRIQASAVVPSILQILLSQPLEDYDLSSLQFLGSGAAPLAPEVENELRRRLPTVSIRQGYGLTETAALISTNPPGRERSGSVGMPVPGVEVRIFDENGDSLPAGEIGEICCRSPGVMRGYWRAEDATAEAIQDGWLHTGDLGYIDPDGYLFIVDRKKDLIIRGGFNVYPRDVEDALVEHPAVHMAGVVGMPDHVHGEEVVAFVALRPGAEATPEELIEWTRKCVSAYMYPRHIHLVDSIPLTNVGKIDRKALRARVGETAEA